MPRHICMTKRLSRLRGDPSPRRNLLLGITIRDETSLRDADENSVNPTHCVGYERLILTMGRNKAKGPGRVFAATKCPLEVGVCGRLRGVEIVTNNYYE